MARLKKCGDCRKAKPLNAYARNTTKADCRQSYCSDCGKRRHKRYYAKYRGRMRRQILLANLRRRRELMRRLLAYLAVKSCVDCGESDPVVLDFDHVRGKKHLEVTTMVRNGYAWPVILREIRKCEIRCANCHRRETARRGRYYRVTLPAEMNSYIYIERRRRSSTGRAAAF